MASQKQEKKIEKKPGGVETAEKKETPKLPAELGKIKEEEKGVKETTAEKASGIKREMLEEEVVGPDKETAEKILSIDLNRESVEQREAYSRLEVVSYTLLGKLLDKGFKKEILEVLESFRSLQVDESIILNGPEKAALKKLKEIAISTGSPLFRDLKEKWKKLVDKANGVYGKSSRARDWLLGEHKEGAKAPWLIQKMKEHPIATAVILGAVAYGTYKIFFGGKKEEGGEEKESIMSKIGLGTWKRKLLVAGLGTLVLGAILGRDKIKDVINKITNIPDEVVDKAWDLFKSGHPIEAVKVLIAWESVGGLKEKGKEALHWLDGKIHFSEMSDRIGKFAQEHGITAPEWVKDLKLSEIARDMGISQENESSWLEYAGIGGAALLLYKWVGNKGLKKGIVLNAGIYLFLVKEGKDSFAGKIIHELMTLTNAAKDKILGGLNQLPGFDVLIDDEFESFKLQDKFDDLLVWMKDHPLESMAAMNGLWLCRHLISNVLKKLMKAGYKLVGYAWNNPVKAGLIGVGVLTLWGAKREVVDDLIKVLYPDNPQGKDAIEMRDSFDKVLGIDRTKPETLPEKHAKDIYEKIVKDPIAAFKDVEVIENFKKGNYAIAILETGAIAIITTGPPIILPRLGWEFFKTNLEHIFSPEREGNILIPMTLAGGNAYVMGTMAWHGFRSYITVIESGETLGRKFWRGIKSLVPLTAEWRFVMKSTLVAPLRPVLNKWNAFMLRDIDKSITEIQQILKKGDLKPSDYEKIKSIAGAMERRNVFKDFNAIQDDLRKATWGSHTYETAEKLDALKKNFKYIEQAADANKLEDLRRHAESAQNNMDRVKNSTGSILRRLKALTEGDFKGAMAMKDSAEDLKRAREEAAQAKKEVEAVKPVETKGELFKGADGRYKSAQEMEKEAERLRKEIAGLAEGDLARKGKMKELAAVEAFLDTSKGTKFSVDAAEIGKLEDAGEKARRLEQLASQMEATEKGMQARFNHEVEKIVAEAKINKLPLTDPAVMEKLEKLDKEILIPFATKKQANIQALNELYGKLPKELRTPALRQQIRHALEGVEGTVMTRLVKGAKGRAKLMVLMGALIFATDLVIHRNDPEREFAQWWAEMGPQCGQLLLDVLPIVGTYSNYYSAFSGREIVTKRDVSGTWDRVSNAVWGTVGLATDTLTVISAIPSGGTSLEANAALRLATKGAKGARLLKAWPRIARMADRMGGWAEFARNLKKYIKMDPGKVEKIIRGLRTVERVGVIGGSVLLAGGVAYHLRYAFTDSKTEIKLHPELMSAEALPEAKKPAAAGGS